MARKNKQQNAQTGGFVPASYQRTYKPNAKAAPATTSAKSAAAKAKPTKRSADRRYTTNSSTAQYSRNNEEYTNYAPKKRRGPKIAVAMLIIVLVAGVSGLGFYVYKEMQKETLNQELHNNVTKQQMEAIDNELTGTTTFDEPFTMLLLGSDARSDDPDMGARTDTIVLVRIDPTKNILSMVSIPRDTKIEIPGYGTNKFNAAYTYGGPGGTIAAVKELTGVDIDHYAEINFENLVDLVDAIGGIDVQVDERIDDWEAGSYVIPEGMQHLNGEATLVFSRSRAYANGDFTRVSNQRKVIEAIVHKGLEAPAADLHGLISTSVNFLTTDSALDVDFIYSLADQIRHNNDYPVTIYSATIPATTAMVGDVSYVVADEEGVRKLMRTFMAGGDVGAEADRIAVEDVHEVTDDVYNDSDEYDNNYSSNSRY